MSDLSDRLRTLRDWFQGQNIVPAAATCWEAATEIERLSAQLAESTAAYGRDTMSLAKQRNEAYRALERYGAHERPCLGDSAYVAPCTCGLSAAIAGAPENVVAARAKEP